MSTLFYSDQTVISGFVSGIGLFFLLIAAIHIKRARDRKNLVQTAIFTMLSCVSHLFVTVYDYVTSTDSSHHEFVVKLAFWVGFFVLSVVGYFAFKYKKKLYFDNE